jgi:hypothetical protein
MRFTPTTFIASEQLGTFEFNANGGTTGTFTSGGIDYSFVKFTSGSYILNVTSGAEVDVLIVGGGAGGLQSLVAGSKGGGGGGVYSSTIRLYKGTYNVNVGQGSLPDANGGNSFISAYGNVYLAGGGAGTGENAAPNNNPAGNDGPVCSGGADRGFGGGGGALVSGSNGFCNDLNEGMGGAGGEGLTYNFDGTPSVYGSGGGGGGGTQISSRGGLGGTNAGNGGNRPFGEGPTNGVDGFGGGGGGESATNTGGAGRGGHGIVIIRYRT